jgi:hypothetical protein
MKALIVTIVVLMPLAASAEGRKDSFLKDSFLDVNGIYGRSIREQLAQNCYRLPGGRVVCSQRQQTNPSNGQ